MTETAVKATEIVITGMTKTEFLAVFVLAVVLIALSMMIMYFVVSLKMAIFKDMPAELKEINSKLKTGDDLQRIAQSQVHEHERRYHQAKPK